MTLALLGTLWVKDLTCFIYVLPKTNLCLVLQSLNTKVVDTGPYYVQYAPSDPKKKYQRGQEWNRGTLNPSCLHTG